MKANAMTSLFDTPVDYEAAFRNFWNVTTDLPTIGVGVGNREGYSLYSNLAFRRIFYQDSNFDPTGMTLEQLEGKEVAEERLLLVNAVCDSGKPVMVSHTRLGFRVESVIYPWKPNFEAGPTNHVVTFSRSTSEISQDEIEVEVFESRFNSWGVLDELTDRQLEVLATLRDGCSQKEAARVLGVTPKTIETHRDQLIRRLGVSSTLEAIRLADRAGLTLENAKKTRHRSQPWERYRNQDSGTVNVHGVA